MAPISFYLSAGQTDFLYFNGSNTEVEYEASAISASVSVTMEAWIYPTALPTQDPDNEATIVECGNAGTVNYMMTMDDNRQIWVRYYNGSWRNHSWATPTVNLNQWNHVCGIIKPDTADGIAIYVNGTKAGSTQNTSNLITNTNNRLRAGVQRNGNYPFSGYMKNIIVTVNADISEAEILQHAADNYSSVTSPDVYWKLDETTGTTASDSSSNGYNGTITNGIWQEIS